jgi:aminoglycoside phosphotransferase
LRFDKQDSTPFAMQESWTPRILRPDFTWPRPIQPIIAKETPPIPSVASPATRWFWGFVHRRLARFSESYCSRFGIPFHDQIIQLPFGLILKWSDRTRIEEAIAMQMARAAGMPVPKVLCYGEHPAKQFRRISILMTRLPGSPPKTFRDPLQVEKEDPWLGELGRCLRAMRTWKSPYDEKLICSVAGTSILSQLFLGPSLGPVKSERELYEHLLGSAKYRGFRFASTEEYEKTLGLARKILNMPHRIVFTHGDLKANNILVDDKGHLSGFIDWESAGWHPEYWEFATPMRLRRSIWWYHVASMLGGDQYPAELECDDAMHRLLLSTNRMQSMLRKTDTTLGGKVTWWWDT